MKQVTFEQFWDKYNELFPGNYDKKACKKAWDKLDKENQNLGLQFLKDDRPIIYYEKGCLRLIKKLKFGLPF